MDKQSIRKEIRRRKQEQQLTQKKEESTSIWKQMASHPLFQKSNNILIYWSMNDEVETPEFIEAWQGKKQFLLPCVVGDQLEIKFFQSEKRLRAGELYQIPEPKGEAISDYGIIDLAIVPGVAFDQHGHRLGRGKGYYDKTLCKIAAPKIGVCFSFQLLDTLPTQKHDIKMDYIFSPYFTSEE